MKKGMRVKVVSGSQKGRTGVVEALYEERGTALVLMSPERWLERFELKVENLEVG